MTFQASDLIQNILSSRGLSQSELADLIGVERSFLSRCLRGERIPGRMSCLLLAGFSESADERSFWLAHSGMDHRQITLIRRALDLQDRKPGTEAERRLLVWWRRPAEGMEQSARDLVEKILDTATAA